MGPVGEQQLQTPDTHKHLSRLRIIEGTAALLAFEGDPCPPRPSIAAVILVPASARSPHGTSCPVPACSLEAWAAGSDWCAACSLPPCCFPAPVLLSLPWAALRVLFSGVPVLGGGLAPGPWWRCERVNGWGVRVPPTDSAPASPRREDPCRLVHLRTGCSPSPQLCPGCGHYAVAREGQPCWCPAVLLGVREAVSGHSKKTPSQSRR